MTTAPGSRARVALVDLDHSAVGVAELGVDRAVGAREDHVGRREAHRTARVEGQVGGGDGLLGDRDDLRLRDVRRPGVRRRDGVGTRLERADDVAADLVGDHAGGEVAVLVEDGEELVGERDAAGAHQAADDAGVPGLEGDVRGAARAQQEPLGQIAGDRRVGVQPLVAVGLDAVGAGGDLEAVEALAVGDRLRGDAAVDTGEVEEAVGAVLPGAGDHGRGLDDDPADRAVRQLGAEEAGVPHPAVEVAVRAEVGRREPLAALLVALTGPTRAMAATATGHRLGADPDQVGLAELLEREPAAPVGAREHPLLLGDVDRQAEVGEPDPGDQRVRDRRAVRAGDLAGDGALGGRRLGAPVGPWRLGLGRQRVRRRAEVGVRPAVAPVRRSADGWLGLRPGPGEKQHRADDSERQGRGQGNWSGPGHARIIAGRVRGGQTYPPRVQRFGEKSPIRHTPRHTPRTCHGHLRPGDRVGPRTKREPR